MSAYTIGVDIGTTGTKAALLDVNDRIIAVASRNTPLHSPVPGAAEADPQIWAANVAESIREVVERSGVSPASITGVATSGMVPALVLLDENLRSLRYAFLQNDARATGEVSQVAAAVSDLNFVELTGSALTQQSVGPKCLWVARSEPDIWKRVRWIVGSYDAVLISLGADPHVEENWAIESGFFALDGSYVTRVLEASGVEDSFLPPVLRPGDQAGVLSAEAAQATGLSAGTPLIVGGADHVLSAYAAGVMNSGDWLIKLGGAGDVLAAADRPIVDERLYLDAHPVQGHWLPNGCMATSGSLLRWLQTLVGGEDLLALDAEASARKAGELLCLPYFLGEKSPLHDPDLRGAFAGLHLGHTRGDLYRSVLEAIAFGFRHHTEVFDDLGMHLTRALITNGGSKSTLWKQIHSEVLNTEVNPVTDHPGASLGAAILAGIGAGSIGRDDPTSRFTKLGDPVIPDPVNVAIYNDTYEQWRALGDAAAPISHALAQRAQP